MGIKLTYGVCVCREFVEIQRLVHFLLQHKRSQDNIVILYDEANGDPEVETFLRTHSINGEFAWYKAKFNRHFADWKNKLSSLCSGDYIFQIDADEIPHQTLIKLLPEVIEKNEFDICLVPRVNTVEGITEEHIRVWGWNVSKLESMIGEKELDLNNPKDLDEYNLLKEYNLIIEETIKD
jgi:hypothetical protein